ncbi:hypothetical protein PUN28_001339 [Cardiocondyla obscurior]|uniref:LAGLIDADG homing endonuclease n=1 Tax=Cardiocondyla obscurior TaxID=286306 RepID=A0AAW2H556_9HYME
MCPPCPVLMAALHTYPLWTEHMGHFGIYIYYDGAPVRVYCKHVEVTEVALRIVSFQTPQQSVASRLCCTNREWYTFFTSQNLFPSSLQRTIHKAIKYLLGTNRKRKIVRKYHRINTHPDYI